MNLFLKTIAFTALVAGLATGAALSAHAGQDYDASCNTQSDVFKGD